MSVSANNGDDDADEDDGEYVEDDDDDKGGENGGMIGSGGLDERAYSVVRIVKRKCEEANINCGVLANLVPKKRDIQGTYGLELFVLSQPMWSFPIGKFYSS